MTFAQLNTDFTIKASTIICYQREKLFTYFRVVTFSVVKENCEKNRKIRGENRARRENLHRTRGCRTKMLIAGISENSLTLASKFLGKYKDKNAFTHGAHFQYFSMSGKPLSSQV